MIVESSLIVPAPAADVWRTVTDWSRHGDWVPLTSMRVLPGPTTGVGTRFVGRTGVGRFAFDDVMEVVAWQPPVEVGALPPGDPSARGGRPGRCEVRKIGKVVTGRAWIEVLPVDETTSRLLWGEDVRLGRRRRLTALAPLGAVAARAGLQRVLAKIAADVAAGPGRGEDSGRVVA
ncbi:MAG: SRPBCC family protein [Kineosporiaceae bacterium]